MKNLILLFTLIASTTNLWAQLPGCATSVNTFPYSEGFETGIGNWNNAAGDQFDWTRDSGGTISGSTGPSTGSNASTFYMYIETSSPRTGGDEAWLESFCFDFTALTSPQISFDYHLYGSSMGTVELLISTDGIAWTSIWSLSGDQGNAWSTANIGLAAYAGQIVEFRFRGAYGTSFRGDAAIDNINIIDQVAMTYTSSTVTQTNTANVENCESDVEIIGLEIVTAGSLTPLDITQLIIQTTGSTAPTADVTNIDIYYTGANASFATTTLYGSAAPLVTGTNILINGTQTLTSGTNYFWIVYDLASASTIGNVLDALCSQITLDANNYIPTITSPAGNRPIVGCTPAPGSISSDLSLWFKSDANVYSDAGTTPAVNGGTVEQWNELSGNGSIANVSTPNVANQPIYRDNPFNYNPAVWFDIAGKILNSGDVPYSSFTDGSKISMYGVIQGISGSTNFTWDDAGVGGKIVLASTTSFFDRTGANGLTTGIGSTNAQQHIVSTVVNSTTMNAYVEGDLKSSGSIVNLTGSTASPIAFGRLFEHGFSSTMYFGELAIYNASHGAVEKNSIESYFAVKYGITLDNAAAGIAGDYTASFSTQVWDADNSANYHNNVIGIARDDNRSLLQKQSHTIDDTTRIYLNTLQNTNDDNAGSLSSDVSYLMVGDNQGKLCANTTINSEIPGTCSLYSRLEREWKITKTNFSEDFNLDVKLSSCALPALVNTIELRLLIDDDGDFSNGGTTCYYNGDGSGIVISYANPIITISGISSTHIANNSTKFATIASIQSNTPLPIELIQFDIDCLNEKPSLNWSTASEVNNDFFTIEKSLDAINFKPVGEVKGNGNSSSLISYNWNDTDPTNGTTFYRLKQTDFDGNNQTVGAKSIYCNQFQDISIYPNPFETSFTVQLSQNSIYPIDIEVVDYLGSTVYSKTVETSRTSINLEKLATGTYFVKVSNEKTIAVKRIVKTR